MTEGSSMKMRIGTAGNGQDFYERGFKTTTQAPAFLKEMGLSAFEYPGGRGMNLSQKTAQRIGEQAALHGIAISFHAPYFTNLCNPAPDKQAKTVAYLMQSARAVTDMGGIRVIFHPGALMKQMRSAAAQVAQSTMRHAVDAVLSAFPSVVLCPETLGKNNQYGTLEEVLSLCAPYGEHVIPCIDFGHLYAAARGTIDYVQILDTAIATLGRSRMNAFHMHFSHIAFTQAGEKKHMCFDDAGYGPDFAPLATALAHAQLHPTLICESAGTQVADAQIMRALCQQNGIDVF